MNQVNLGEIIAALEAEDPNRVLPIGFTSPHSYRGYYDELAFEPAGNVTVGTVLEAARSAIGATYTGYKGGDYTMHAETACHIASYGECGEPIGPVMWRLLLGQPSPPPVDEPRDAGALVQVRTADPVSVLLLFRRVDVIVTECWANVVSGEMKDWSDVCALGFVQVMRPDNTAEVNT